MIIFIKPFVVPPSPLPYPAPARRALLASAIVLASLASLASLAGWMSPSARATPIEWNNSGTAYTDPANWVGGVVPADSGATDIAVFGSIGAAATSPTVAANRTINGLIFNEGAFQYTFAGSGVFRIGSNGIVNNSGTVQTFNGPLSLNANDTWTNSAGSSLVVNGTLDINPSGTSARTVTLAGTGETIFNGVVLNTNVTGNMNVTGGVVQLNGANTYTGNTNVTGGTLKLGHSSALGSTVNGTIVNGGTVDLNGQAIGAESFTLSGNGTGNVGALINGSGTAASLSGNIALNSNSMISASGGALTISGNIDLNTSGTSSRTLAITGSHDVTLSGNLSHSSSSVGSTGNLNLTNSAIVLLSGNNTFTGNITVNADATLKVGSATALGANANFTNVGSGGVVDLNGYNASKPLRITGSGISSSGAVINTNATTSVVSTVVTLSGTATIGAGNITFANTVSDGGAAKGITKRDSGTLTLSAVNTYTGPTAVRDGTLLVNGSLDALSTVSVSNHGTLGGSGTVKGATSISDGSIGSSGSTLTLNSTLTTTGEALLNAGSTVNVLGGTTVSSGAFAINGTLNGTLAVASGATLSGSGFITGATTIGEGATLAPGNSPGTLSFGNDLTLVATSISLFQVGGNTTLGTDYDHVSVSGQLTFGGDLNVVAVDLGGGIYNFGQPSTLSLFSFGSATGNFDTVTVGGSNLAYDSGLGVWSANVEGYDYHFSPATGTLTISAAGAIPEPSTYAALIGFVALAGAFIYRRNRRA